MAYARQKLMIFMTITTLTAGTVAPAIPVYANVQGPGLKSQQDDAVTNKDSDKLIMKVGEEITLTYDKKHHSHMLYFEPEETGMYTLYTENPVVGKTQIYMWDEMRIGDGELLEYASDPQCKYRENTESAYRIAENRGEKFTFPTNYYARTGYYEKQDFYRDDSGKVTPYRRIEAVVHSDKKVSVTFKLKKHTCTMKHYLDKASFGRWGHEYDACTACGKVDLDTLEDYLPVDGVEREIPYTGKRIFPRLYTTYTNGERYEYPRIYDDTKWLLVPRKYYAYDGKAAKTIGTHRVTVKLEGNYFGKRKFYYKIVPNDVKKLSVKRNGKNLKIKWSKVKGAKKYQVKISGKKKGTFVTNKTSLKLKAPKKGKYTVRVRAFKKVKGKRYYSSEWKTVEKKL